MYGSFVFPRSQVFIISWNVLSSLEVQRQEAPANFDFLREHENKWFEVGAVTAKTWNLWGWPWSMCIILTLPLPLLLRFRKLPIIKYSARALWHPIRNNRLLQYGWLKSSNLRAAPKFTNSRSFMLLAWEFYV